MAAIAICAILLMVSFMFGCIVVTSRKVDEIHAKLFKDEKEKEDE